MSKLTFDIDPEAALVGLTRVSPWASLRGKLFGADTGQAQYAARLAAMNQKIAAGRVCAPPALNIVRPPPAKAAAPRISVSPPTGIFQVEYKDRMICASQLEDGSWIASHHPIGQPALPDAPHSHRFMARILAIASAEIEIDDLEKL